MKSEVRRRFSLHSHYPVQIRHSAKIFRAETLDVEQVAAVYNAHHTLKKDLGGGHVARTQLRHDCRSGYQEFQTPARSGAVGSEVAHHNRGEIDLFDPGVRQPQLRAWIAADLKQRQQQPDLRTPERAQHGVRGPYQGHAKNSELHPGLRHAQPTFCATYGANRVRTVWSTRPSEK